MTNDRSFGGVTIGNVSGGIHGSIIAGRDVSGATITLGGQPTSAGKQPTFDELRLLLIEVQRDLAELAAQKDALKEISPARGGSPGHGGGGGPLSPAGRTEAGRFPARSRDEPQ